MPRRSLLSDTERDSLLVLPQSQDDLIQQYSFTDADLALIRQRRGAANRLGFAVQMCLLRYPGYALASDTALPDSVLHWIAKQVRSDAGAWPEYGEREKTRNEHLHELRAYLGLSVFGLPDFRKLVTAWPTSLCRPTRRWSSPRIPLKRCARSASSCRRSLSSSGPAPRP